MSAEEKRIALLIDAENISAQYASHILDEVSSYGVCTYKRIYGSWDRIVHTKWEKELNKNSIRAMMQLNNTRGKNASDSALIIDAMDILYSDRVDAFCIVSSDSDFTSLARRLMESGMMVIGMGESDKATEALENAFDKYVYIDVLARQAEKEKRQAKKQEREESGSGRGGSQKSGSDSGKDKSGNIPSKKTVENRIRQIIQENNDRSRVTDLGEIGSKLNNTFRNFDVRYYGKKYLKDFVGDLKSLAMEDRDDRVIVTIRDRK